ncbi:MAG: D-beta-D-heptose 1-phosphate adenosyltransferase, partial [Nocardiopsaceae bacterium]|nr:D-beta-D-heptose 1-phosphate adenosyltransferase [Nocardiopsaceae bacterium]
MTAGPLVVLGDALLDRDITGHARRLCPDAPAPVVEQGRVRTRPGGAALAALLAGAWASEVVLIAPFGDDAASRTVLGLLPSAVTVIGLPLDGALQEKTRVMAGGRTLLRLDTPAPLPAPGHTAPASGHTAPGRGHAARTAPPP